MGEASIEDVPRPLGKRLYFEAAARYAEVILTTLERRGAKRIPIVGSYKALQNQLRYWFPSRHPTLAFHSQITKDGRALDCWVTRRAVTPTLRITDVTTPTRRRAVK
jgi:hypothetical protein